jgi:preprotein translocase subunit YajC
MNVAFAEEVVAESADPKDFNSVVGGVVPVLIFFFFFYLLLIRPQQKKDKEHQKEIEGLKPNDKVVSAGGIYGKVKKVTEKSVLVEVAENVTIEMLPTALNLVKDQELKK